MRMLPSVPRRLLCVAAAAGLALFADGGCSAGDGTIALPSPLDPRVQAAATRMMRYSSTHVGVLSNPDALRELHRVLEATTAKEQS